MRIRLLPAFAILVALAACEDAPAGPVPLRGAYVLESVGGEALPVLLSQRNTTYGDGRTGMRSEWMTAYRFTITPTSADTVQLIRRIEWDLDTGEDPDPSTVVDVHASPDFVRGDTLCFGPAETVEFAAACGLPMVLERRGSRLVTTVHRFSPNLPVELVFAREP